jgi:diguanylate cyclase (GGDEF)-like protein
MAASHVKLRRFYIALCAAQLVITGMGLALAYQVERSYSLNVDYEKSVNAEHQAINELEVYARDAKPERVTLDDSTSGPSQLSQIDYASKLFLKKARNLLDQSDREPNSPLVHSQADLRTLISEMGMVADQNRLAQEAWAQQNEPLFRARLTYADRSATRVLTVLGSINQDMSHAKDEMLAKEGSEARRAHIILGPLSILGILLVIPALLYARSLNQNIWSYETELEKERNLLEERVGLRTAELSSEIKRRERIEAFDGGRNRVLERVVEGKNPEEVLSQLAQTTEQSVPDSRCFILLRRGQNRSVIAPNIPPDLATSLEAFLLRGWDLIPADRSIESCVMFRDIDPEGNAAFRDAWSQGFRGLFAVPVTDPEQPLLGVVALLLRARTPDDFAREVLLSTSRVASVVLKHDRMQDELFRRAHYDSLTDLPNRVLFEDRLEQAVALASRRKSSVGILCIDIDEFKQVNDEYGHHTGDLLLQQVARRLASNLRKTDTIARLGGDEFVAVVHDAQEGEGAAQVGESLVRALAEPFVLGDITLRTTASIGAAMFPLDGSSCVELRRNADLALYRAKERGRNTFHMFSAELGVKLARRKQIEANLQEALDHEGFELYYQPIYTVSRALVGLEGLIRFRRPDLKSISPAEFIVVAEQTRRISQLGEWVLHEACCQSKRWQEEGFSPVPIAVNVSAVQLARSDFAERVALILGESGLHPAGLQLEITETAIMKDFEEGARQLSKIAVTGVHISIDDFGTGQSSLSYIHRLPIKTLKIDRSFVKNIVDSYESAAIVRAIVAMARSLELSVIAEGVETEEQLGEVVRAGCDIAQGYFFARPLDCSSVSALLERELTIRT